MPAHVPVGLSSLQSLDAQQLDVLGQLGVRSIGDLLAYRPIREAALIVAARDGLVNRTDIATLVDDSARALSPEELLSASPSRLASVNRDVAGLLALLGMRTIGDLAGFAAFREAEHLLEKSLPAGSYSGGDEERDPFAPHCVLPSCKNYTRNTKTYTSYFKEVELRNLSVMGDDNSLVSNLFSFYHGQPKVVHLGYSVSYVQEWTYCGIHLGEELPPPLREMLQRREVLWPPVPLWVESVEEFRGRWQGLF